MIRLAATARRVATVTAVALAVVAVQAAPSGAAWTMSLAAGGTAQASSGTLTAPGGATSICTGAGANKDEVRITWNAVSRATSYTIERSTTSSAVGFSTFATGVTGTSYLTNPPAGTYWFRVVAARGSWTSPPSTATGPRTTGNNSCT